MGTDGAPVGEGKRQSGMMSPISGGASVPIPKFVRLLSTLRTNFGIVRTLATL
jgi:hypothetical protein